MRIAMLTTDGREMLRSYQENQPIFGTAPQALITSFALQPELEVHVISCTQQPLSSSEKLAANIWFHSLVVPKFGWLRTGYQGCIRVVRKKLEEIDPDIVHGQGTERECGICAAFSGFPNVLTIHGNMLELARLAKARLGSYLWCTARLENFTLKRVGGVLCNSKYTENAVRPRTRQTWMVPNPVREVFFKSPRKQLNNNRCIILSVGTITNNKHQLELLAIAEHLALREGLPCEWHFVGQANAADPYVSAFLEQIKDAQQKGFARFDGLRLVPELLEDFDRSSALVHFPMSESFGLVVAEALARDLKVFSAGVGGILDIAAGIEGVELFDPGDWLGLESAIAKWIRTGCPAPLGASKVIRERYHPDVIARRHVEIYQEILRSDS